MAPGLGDAAADDVGRSDDGDVQPGPNGGEGVPVVAVHERKRAEGKSRREAIRCLKRLLARVVFNTLKTNPALT